MSIGGEPACPVAVLWSCRPSNTRRKAGLSGRASRNTLALRTVVHTVQVRRVPAHRGMWASRTGGTTSQNPTSCPVVRGGAANSRENICKTMKNRNLTRTLCRCGHTRALRSVQRMPPGECATHLPAPRWVQGIVPIDVSDLGTCQKNHVITVCHRRHTADRAQPYTPSDAGKPPRQLRGSKYGPLPCGCHQPGPTEKFF